MISKGKILNFFEIETFMHFFRVGKCALPSFRGKRLALTYALKMSVPWKLKVF